MPLRQQEEVQKVLWGFISSALMILMGSYGAVYY